MYYNDFEKKNKHNNLKRLVVLAVFLMIFYVFFSLFRPLPKPKYVLSLKSYQSPGTLSFNWPADIKYGVIGTLQSGIISKTNEQGQWPLASVAKIMTAYIILKDHPLRVGEEGPSFTVTQKEVNEYEAFKKDGQSVAKVALGEKLTERQLLEGLMIPSANNFSYILARWDAGSVANFVKKMNQTAKELGLNNSHYDDPSGAKASTASSPIDQFKLASLAMQIPTFRHIVAMPQVNLPVAGIQYNVNYDLGKDNIVGIKTGSSIPAGANFVFDSVQNGIDIIGVIFGAEGKAPLMTALKEAINLTDMLKNQLSYNQIINKNQPVGYIELPWSNKKADIITTKELQIVTYPGMNVSYTLDISKNLKLPIKANEEIGNLVVKHGDNTTELPVIATQNIESPGFLYKLKNIF